MLVDFYKQKTINNTSLFFIPIVSECIGLDNNKSSLLKFISENGFVNAYIDDYTVNVEQIYNNCVFLLFDKSKIEANKTIKLSATSDIITLHQYLISHKNCKDYYDYKDKYRMYVISVEKFKEDYSKIIKGEYTKFSQKLINLYSTAVMKNTVDAHILYLEHVVKNSSKLKKYIITEFNLDKKLEFMCHTSFNVKDEILIDDVKPFNYVISNSLFSKIIVRINAIK